MARVVHTYPLDPNDRLFASIRVYCDNDIRWQLKPDRPNDLFPNSRRPTRYQEWFDNSNTLSHYGPTCATDPSIIAATYSTPYTENGVTDVDGRVTITVTDQIQSPGYRLLNTLSYAIHFCCNRTLSPQLRLFLNLGLDQVHGLWMPLP